MSGDKKTSEQGTAFHLLSFYIPTNAYKDRELIHKNRQHRSTFTLDSTCLSLPDVKGTRKGVVIYKVQFKKRGSLLC